MEGTKEEEEEEDDDVDISAWILFVIFSTAKSLSS
jgi:hypothetical protein